MIKIIVELDIIGIKQRSVEVLHIAYIILKNTIAKEIPVVFHNTSN